MSLVTLIFLFFFCLVVVTGNMSFTDCVKVRFMGYRTLVPISPSDCVVLKRRDATRTAQCMHKHLVFIPTQYTQHCLAVLLLCYDTFTVQHKGVNYE